MTDQITKQEPNYSIKIIGVKLKYLKPFNFVQANDKF